WRQKVEEISFAAKCIDGKGGLRGGIRSSFGLTIADRLRCIADAIGRGLPPLNQQENQMARNATNPLAAALDKRIRAMVEETVEKAVREEVRTALREELSSLLGTISTAAPAAPTKRAGRPAK